jgi:hypothetical protein
MSDPRSDIITAIRTRLATVTGLWPVAYAGGPAYTPVPGTSYLAEEFLFGEENDTAVPAPNGTRWREVNENYQLVLRIPPETDVRTASDMAGSIARTFMDTVLTTGSGTPIWFNSYRLNSRGLDSGWQKFVLVLTYKAIYNV